MKPVELIEIPPSPLTVNKMEPSKKIFDDAANYDAFLTLLEVIDLARFRMRDILPMISDANTCAIDLLPFGDDERKDQPTAVISKTEHDHLQWLHGNWHRTKYIMGVGMEYFQQLYGDSFVGTTTGKSRDYKNDTTT
jgi:hypothetical protein